LINRIYYIASESYCLKKNRGHIASILFGSLMFLPLIFIILLQAYLFYLSSTAIERMDDRRLETVVVEEHKVEWREAGREVTIDGAYFDLVSWELENGLYTFTGVYDEEETAVMEILGKQQGFWNSIISLLIMGQCFALFIFYIVQFFKPFYFLKHHSFFENRYQFLFRKIIAPPPRLLV
jgi:uncharacterized membrane protein